MWTSILALFNAALGLVNRWLDAQAADDLKQLGRYEQEAKHQEEQRRNEAIASEIDARPLPDDDALLDGLLSPAARKP